MKKIVLFGSLCLALSMASCKTYCPAYSSVQPNTNETTETVTVSVSAPEVAADETNS